MVSERLKGPPLTVSHQPLGRHQGETTALLVIKALTCIHFAIMSILWPPLRRQLDYKTITFTSKRFPIVRLRTFLFFHTLGSNKTSWSEKTAHLNSSKHGKSRQTNWTKTDSTKRRQVCDLPPHNEKLAWILQSDVNPCSLSVFPSIICQE